MKCEEEGCKHEATHSVTINIPAVGVPIDCHQPLKFYVDVKLCITHAKEFDKGFSWSENEDLKDTINDFVQETKFGARDYNRTFSSVIKLTDSNFQEVQRYLENEGV